jgi:glycyl-tRNA synthetase alpha subunit|nr:MAG: tail tube protein [Bacteriophage sp.]
MKEMEAKRAIYGTRSEVWLDGDKIAEATACKATLTADKVEVKMAMHQSKGYKQVGYTGKGSIKLHKVSSYFIKKIAPSIKEGKQCEFTIISKLADPDAYGVERVALYKVQFDSVDLINWEVGKLGEESYNFTFEDYDMLDEIDA